MITIQQDGIAYPLETFIDARGFTRTDGEVPPFVSYTGALEVLTRDGKVRHEPEARCVAWHEVIAAHAPNGPPCAGCGMPFDPTEPPIYASDVATRRVFVVNEFDAEYCADCQADGEWEY